MSSVSQQLSTTSSALVARARGQLAVVQAQWVALPETLRKTWEQLRERIQVALELPTKDDLGKLSSRLDDLDAKIAALLAARGADVPAASELHAAAPVTASKKASKKKG